MLREIRPGITTLNYGCTGETSVTFIQGGCFYTASGFPLHDPYDGSQLSAALAFLRAHRGQVSPITINLGTNDLNALTASCGSDASCYFENGPAVLDSIATNLDYILSELRAAAPDARSSRSRTTTSRLWLTRAWRSSTQAFNAAVVSTAAAVVGASGGCVRRL